MKTIKSDLKKKKKKKKRDGGGRQANKGTDGELNGRAHRRGTELSVNERQI